MVWPICKIDILSSSSCILISCCPGYGDLLPIWSYPFKLDSLKGSCYQHFWHWPSVWKEKSICIIDLHVAMIDIMTSGRISYGSLGFFMENNNTSFSNKVHKMFKKWKKKMYLWGKKIFVLFTWKASNFENYVPHKSPRKSTKEDGKKWKEFYF